MAMKKASGDDSPLRQGAGEGNHHWRVPGRAFGPSRTQVNGGGGLQYFSWIDVWELRVFPMK
jgi:hypothetical protein